MFNSSEEKIRDIDKKLLLMAVLDTPGMLMLALWVYARFGSNDEPLHPLLANPLVVNGLLYAGVAIVVFCALQIVRLGLRKAELKKAMASGLQ